MERCIKCGSSNLEIVKKMPPNKELFGVRCKDCGKERELTAQERDDFNG